MARVQRALPDEAETKQTFASEARSPEQRDQERENRSHEAAESKPEEPKKSLVRRHPLVTLVVLLALVALAVGGYFAWAIYLHPYETTDDAFIDARSFALASKVSGYVEEVGVTDNQHVAAGALIASIAPRDYQIAVDQAKAQVDSAKAAITNAEAQIDVSAAAIDEAKARQTSAQAGLQLAQDEAKRQRDLQQGGAGSIQTLQQSESSLRQAQASGAEAQAAVLSAMKTKTAAEAQKNSAAASLKQAQAQLEGAEQNLAYTRLTAAQPGRVVKISGAKGQFVQAGQAIAMFVPDEIWVTANFKETQLADMRPGQPVDLTIDSYPDHLLHGQVDSVQPGSGTAFSLLPAQNATGNYVKVTQRVPVKIVVKEWPKDVSIGPGMSVVPTVTVRPRN